MGLEGAWQIRLFPRFVYGNLMGKLRIFTCDIIDDVEASMFYSGTGFWRAQDAWPYHIKRALELLFDAQSSTGYCIGKHTSIVRDLKPSNFNPKEKLWTKFPQEG
ncbi:unnamed protein product [Prunus armeniaca]|uniref:Uncharacterized protein n=1 Tax=Prunus armeniaca TaxID=36596 RepID=A0A6J5Y209_PRUAR|nr:unnamed protein product [Prunus armeniaca]